MSDNWKVGDLALCVGIGDDDAAIVMGIPIVGFGPIVGMTYTVNQVKSGFDFYGRKRTALTFREIGPKLQGSNGYNSKFFIKATPPQADEFDREVIELMTKKKVDTSA
jgi:hypothetical protein